MICVVTLSNFFGVSAESFSIMDGARRKLYFFTMAAASWQVLASGWAGPEAMLSSRSPSTSESTTARTGAGVQARAKRPPFTEETRLRSVLISTMSAPQASS